MLKIKEIKCKSAIGKCGFLGGGFAINPYVGCGHACVYCYARFIKRFTGHKEKWGTFIDARMNIAEVLERQLKSGRYKKEKIYIGTVTDPYQPIESKYRLTRKILEVLVNYKNPVSILTKSSMVLRDIDLLKKLNKVDVNFTITTLDEKWARYTEPYSSSIKQRLEAMEKLTDEGITVFAMMGPYWPIFRDAESLFEELKKVGVSTKPYLPSIHLFDFYRKKFGYKLHDFPISEAMSAQSLALPIYIGLTYSDCQHIAGKLINEINK